MAVSNSIGSNVFDILIGLALPWFLTTAIIYPGSVAHINSNGLVFSVSLLFFTVIFTVRQRQRQTDRQTDIYGNGVNGPVLSVSLLFFTVIFTIRQTE